MPACRLRIAAQELVGDVARLLDQRGIALEVGEAQERHAGSSRAEELARPADRKILPRDLEAVGVLVDHLQALARGVAHRLLEKQDALALGGAAADTAAELMELREA